ncbi:TetR/AcrR family transcriptional regulator [Breznakiella homolactica]|uniref:TetR/AcrR family transcriptional regulator n=1 Tax=Breznakiella homolactica TaxID=2798577 RepID=A0A7T8BA49_9SPIR|nr:TetR/AcrR family transcriptional regulator [Breznakiella homolactica]QQO07863.1 TetR/AcrR family transcriptional regulator [Breznakiella homolactica]
MQKGQLHPAATLSKNLLAKGLFSLMQKKPFTDITIMELCEASQVSRRTFYRHFDNTGQVAAYQTRGIIDEFTAAMKEQKNRPYEAVIEAYFVFWKTHAPLLTLLNQNNLTYVIFTPYLTSLGELPWLFPPHGADHANQEEYFCVLAYHSGGLWSLLTYWIMNGCALSERTLAETVVKNNNAGGGGYTQE